MPIVDSAVGKPFWRRRSKYNAQPVVVDGVRFSSKAEAKRDAELQLLAKAGVIQDLKRQPRYPLVVQGVKVATYVGDWAYVEIQHDKNWPNAAFGQEICEDRKGVLTPVFKLKFALAKALYPNTEFRLS